MFKKALVLSLSFLFVNTQADDNKDSMNYMLGNYSVDGFDSVAEEKYKAKIIVKKTFSKDNKIVIYSVLIEHNEGSGLSNYFGFISDFKDDSLTIDYQNSGKQRHQVTCDHTIDKKMSSLACKGSLLGNVGGDGEFVMLKELE